MAEREHQTEGFSTRQVAELCGLQTRDVLRYVRCGALEPERDGAGHMRFTFADVALLRSLRKLSSGPGRRVLVAVRRLQERGHKVKDVSWHAEGRDLLVRDALGRFNPVTGQAVLEFDSEPAATVTPLADRLEPSHAANVLPLRELGRHADAESDIEALERRAAMLELADVDAAVEIYQRILAARPGDRVAAINLGRLLHETGRIDEAITCYREALDTSPADALAWFNLGVALEDLGDEAEALEAYLEAVEHDPAFADAHYNAARIWERRGEEIRALRHLRAYRDLTKS